MSQNRNAPPRTRPDLGRPTDRRRSRRDSHTRAKEEEQEAVVEGVTGLRPEVPVVEEPFVTTARPGWFAAVATGGAAALAGWVLLAALASLAWLSAPVGAYPPVLRVATQLWLAGHAGGLVLEGTRWTLVPYGLTLVLVVLLAQVSTAVLRRLGDTDDGPALAGPARAALFAASYAGMVGLTGLLAGGLAQSAKALAGALLVAGVAAWWARSRTAGRARVVRWPSWVVALARGLGAGLALLAAMGSAALVTGLLVHRGRLVLLTDELGGGVVGGLGAVLAQAAYLPTFVVWSTSYTLGAGFGLGDGSLVSPADTHLGLLPAWPITAALPSPGPGAPLDLAWLAGGVVAGGLAAWAYLRRSPWTRPDTTMLFGGLVGLLLGLLVTLAGLLTRGDLGVARLSGLGPRPLELLVLAGVLTTTGGLVAGLAYGIRAWGRIRRATRNATGAVATAVPAEGTGGTAPGEPVGAPAGTPRGSAEGPEAAEVSAQAVETTPRDGSRMAPPGPATTTTAADTTAAADPASKPVGPGAEAQEPVEVTGPVLLGRSVAFGAEPVEAPSTTPRPERTGPASDSTDEAGPR